MQTTEIGRGIVSSRVALLLRSAEIQPLSSDLFGFTPKHPPPWCCNARGRLKARGKNTQVLAGWTPPPDKGSTIAQQRLNIGAKIARQWSNIGPTIAQQRPNNCPTWVCTSAAVIAVVVIVTYYYYDNCSRATCRVFEHVRIAEVLGDGSSDSGTVLIKFFRNSNILRDTFIPPGIQAIPSELAT